MMRKLIIMTLAVLLAGFSVTGRSESVDRKTVTLMIYICGTNLESEYGAATEDYFEMLSSGVDLSQVNLILMMGGTSEWTYEPFNSEKTVIRDPITNVWEEERLNMGDPETLRMFLDYCVEAYPADKYGLILWDHGEGPLGTLCMDELYKNDGLTLDELTHALSASELYRKQNRKLSFIGFDACLMGTVEVALGVEPYAEYMIASQETEPKGGWNYSFLCGIENDENGAETGNRIIQAYFESEDGEEYGNTLSCIDLSKVDKLAEEMDRFFMPISQIVNEESFATLSGIRSTSADFGRAVRAFSTRDFDLVDLGDLIDHYSTLYDVSSLREALDETVVISQSNRENGVNGLSIYHPLYNQADYLDTWREDYTKIHFSKGYQTYLNVFGTILTGGTLADWNDIYLTDEGLREDGTIRYSLSLTENQHENIAHAQLLILGSISNAYREEVYDVQLSESSAQQTGKEVYYYPVWSSDIPDMEGTVLQSLYSGESLYLLNEEGKAIAGPIGYHLSDDGQEWYVHMKYQDHSAREELRQEADVIYTCTLDKESGKLNVISTSVYDAVTETYTRRIAFSEENYTDLYIDRQARVLPEGSQTLPGFDEWEESDSSIAIELPMKWHLQVMEEQLSGTLLYATVQVTDVQNRTYCTPLIRVQNPNLMDIEITPRTYHGDDFDLTLYAVMDNSALTPGLSISMEVTVRPD